jgi:transcriptional regulator with PAS, ATPase and Fis domain
MEALERYSWPGNIRELQTSLNAPSSDSTRAHIIAILVGGLG